jgi:hypothetical protein
MILKIPFTVPYKSVLDLHPNCWEITYCKDTQKENTIKVTIQHSTKELEIRYLSYLTREEMELAYRFLEANI